MTRKDTLTTEMTMISRSYMIPLITIPMIITKLITTPIMTNMMPMIIRMVILII